MNRESLLLLVALTATAAPIAARAQSPTPPQSSTAPPAGGAAAASAGVQPSQQLSPPVRDFTQLAVPVGPMPGGGTTGIVPVPDYATSTAARVEGRRLFLRYNCAGCHGDHGGGGMGPSLRDEDWLYGKTQQHIFNSIAEGRAHGMPAWGTRLPQDQIWKLSAYVISLQTDQEPEAPR